MINLKKHDNVADAVQEVLEGKLHPNQQKLDVHEPEKDELTADDFKKLRAKKEVKKEEVEQVDEAKKESKEDFDARQKRLVAAGNETAKDPERLKKLSKIPGYNAAMNLAKKSTNEEVKDEYARKVDKYLKKKYNKEEVEQIDELKKSTMGSYVKKASSNLADRSFDHGESEHRQYGMGDDDEKDKEVERDEKKIETRKQGISRAASKLSKESVQIDELSKSTLGSYAKKATDDATYHSFSAGTRSSKDPERLKDDEKAMKRQSGVNKAVDRLAKEETGDKKMKTLNQFREGWNEMLADVKKRSQPQPNGGSGIKQGSRYGGGKQTSTPDQEAEKNEKKK